MKKWIILGIEGSSGDISLSIFKDGVCIIENQYLAENYKASESILPALDSVLKETGVKKEKIIALTTTTGPGSFTSIRVALASVWGLSLGLKIPVYSLDSLKSSALAAFYCNKIQEKQKIKVALKAYGGELYTADFSKDSLLKEKPTKAKIQTPEVFLETVKKENFLVGNGFDWLVKSFGFKVSDGQNFIGKNYLLSSNLTLYLLSLHSLEKYKTQKPTFLRKPEAERNFF